MFKFEGIREDLITNTKSALGNQRATINVNIKGDGLKTTRIITLKGVVSSKEEKKKAQEIAKAVEGVAGVDNQLIVQKPKESPKPQIGEDLKEEITKPKVVTMPIPSPYTVAAVKSQDGKVVLNGYVLNSKEHQELLDDAKALFGEERVSDNLKESIGAPEAWLETAKLALKGLKDLDYGEFNISDNNFTFKGFIGSDAMKKSLLSRLKSQINGAYKGEFSIEAPMPIPSPYTVSAVKSQDGKVVLNGYVLNSKEHQELLDDAKALFGEERVSDNLKESIGAPEAWLETAKIALKGLKDLDYGEFNISDNNFTFKGFIATPEAKESLVKSLESKLDNRYHGTYEINSLANSQEELVGNEQTSSNLQVQINQCKRQIDELLNKKKIHFANDRAVIKKESYKLLESLVEIIHNCPDTIVTIEGHTDSVGSAKYNQILSLKRANAVKSYLIKKGIAKERLRAVGYGETKPVASNATLEGRRKNRRIEFKFEGVQR